MTLDRWNCTSYCLCKSRKGHFEKASDDGVWVLYEDAQAAIDRLEKKCAALAKVAYPVHPDPTGKTREPPHCPTCDCGSTEHPGGDSHGQS